MFEAGDVIRVSVVDDHRVVREGLRSYFALLDDIEAAGEASDGRAALDALARARVWRSRDDRVSAADENRVIAGAATPDTGALRSDRTGRASESKN